MHPVAFPATSSQNSAAKVDRQTDTPTDIFVRVVAPKGHHCTYTYENIGSHVRVRAIVSARDRRLSSARMMRAAKESNWNKANSNASGSYYKRVDWWTRGSGGTGALERRVLSRGLFYSIDWKWSIFGMKKRFCLYEPSVNYPRARV